MFFVALSEDLPAPIQAMFADLFVFFEGIPHLRSQTLEQFGPFLDLQAFPVDDDLPVRRIFLPMHFVLSMVEMSEGRFPPGYGTGNK